MHAGLPEEFGIYWSRLEVGYDPTTPLLHGHRQVHTCGMEVCELTAVALTLAPLSTSPRLA
jgi:hypothetical protein